MRRLLRQPSSTDAADADAGLVRLVVGLRRRVEVRRCGGRRRRRSAGELRLVLVLGLQLLHRPLQRRHPRPCQVAVLEAHPVAALHCGRQRCLCNRALSLPEADDFQAAAKGAPLGFGKLGQTSSWVGALAEDEDDGGGGRRVLVDVRQRDGRALRESGAKRGRNVSQDGADELVLAQHLHQQQCSKAAGPQQRRSIAVVVVCHRAAGCLRRAEAPHQRPQVDAVRLGCLSKPLPCVGPRFNGA
mmetsp:Transcript_28799/g.85208  ORF Transcript_28799/g.85208 Transcript_28799/m.85208 type:complete len:244 (+) Transcript_28799:347-1078(+)